MADTARSLAALQVLLADNTTGLISPQDLRDFLLSTSLNSGELFVSATAAGTPPGVGTFFVPAGTTTLLGPAVNAAYGPAVRIDMPANFRLRYANPGGPTRVFQVQADVTITSGSNNQDIAVTLAKNGTALTELQMEQRLGTGTDKATLTVVSQSVSLDDTDTVELQIANNTSTGTLTVERCTLSIVGRLT